MPDSGLQGLKLIILENASWRVRILPSRGLIEQIHYRHDSEEHALLWAPEEEALPGKDAPTPWVHGGIPLLFPFAGRSYFDGEIHRIKLRDKLYEMPLHGFAYGMRWENPEAAGDARTSLRLALRDSEWTRERYPFGFQFQLEINLRGPKLEVEIAVQHSEKARMPTTPGFHPYFNAKILSPDFATLLAASQAFPIDAQGLADLQTLLAPPPFSADSSHWKQMCVDAQNQRFLDLNSQVRMEWSKNLNHLVLWTAKPLDYYCIEPWASLPNAYGLGLAPAGLEPGESRSWQMNFVLNQSRMETTQG